MNLDIEKKLSAATGDKNVVPDDWMPSSRLRPFILRDPGLIWLEFHGKDHDLKPDRLSPDSFFEFIVEKSNVFKEEWIKKQAKGAKQVCEESYHVRYAKKVRQTLILMEADSPIIVQPALWWAPEQIYGVPDLLVHTSWLKENFPPLMEDLKNHADNGDELDGYVIFEVRLGSQKKLEKEADEAQIRFNNYLLGQIQGWMPPQGFLITRREVLSPKAIEMNSHLDQALDSDLADIRDHYLEIKARGNDLKPWQNEQVFINHAEKSERWRTAKGLIAWDKTSGGDLEAIYKISALQKRELVQRGFDNIDDLLNANPSDIPLKDLTNIGTSTANKIRAIFQANCTGIPVLPEPDSAPNKKDFEFYVDFEYFNNLNFNAKKEWPRLRGQEMIFMIGVGWEQPQGKWNFEPFIAKKESPDQEGEMIEAFINFLEAKTNGELRDPDKTALYHWTGAEITQSNKAAVRQKLSDDHPFKQLPWIDLQKSFLQTPCGVPGAWGFGLKEVAKGLGKLDKSYDPQWVGDMADGLGAMVLGWRAYEKKNPLTSNEMKILQQYLQADCKALWCILSWMRTNEPGLPFGDPGQNYVGWDKVEKGFSKPAEEEAFAALNDGKGVIIYLQPVLNARKGIKEIQHLIWGDYMRVLESQGNWRKVDSRGTTGWIHKNFIQEDRLLEVNFVDVGQGDGCFIVTPDDRYILIDAGQADHMYRFLRWRFHHFQQPITFDAAIITHPDKDHYYGFQRFFDDKDEAVQNLHVERIYHNGIIERKSGDLGTSKKIDGVKYVTEIVTNRSELQQILNSIRGGDFLGTLRKADRSGRVNDIRMLAAGKLEPTFMEGYEQNQELSFQVLAPVPEGPDDQLQLRWFNSSAGKTKNGHSIVLRLEYKDVYMLLGGDLNIPAEDYLLEHYGESAQPIEDLNDEQVEAVIKKAREFFVSDIAKSCHHGSADVRGEFLRATNAIATVVSSGDNESHCHPRPESLGLLGRHGRGERPLIFSTELARSSEEIIKHPWLVRRDLEQARSKDRETEFIDQLLQDLGRSVAVYGMITVRTNGEHAIIAQKLEKQRSNGQKWDITLLEPGDDGRLVYKSKH